MGANEIEGRGPLPIPDGYQALSIGLDVTSQVAGFVTPGDNVGILHTLPTGDGTNKTRFLLQNVRCWPSGRPPSPTGPRRAAAGSTRARSQSLTAITLAVEGKHVEKVAHAAEAGQIYLTLMPRNAKPAPRSAVASPTTTSTRTS